MNKRLRRYFEQKLKHKEPKFIKVTAKQTELIKALATGATIREIAENLKSNYNNIQKRTQLLYKKFDVNNRSELIQKAISNKIICTRDVKNRFRKRFNRNIQTEPIPQPKEPLTEQEIKYLRLLINGATKKKIIRELKLLNIGSCNCIQYRICYKLNAESRNQALYYAGRLGLIS